MLQLDFFEKDEVALLRMEVEAQKKSQDKMRKSQFGRIGVLEKNVKDLNERLAILEAQICKGILNEKTP